MKKYFYIMLLMAVISGSCAHILKSKDKLRDRLNNEQTKSVNLEERVEYLELQVMALELDFEILQAEVETMSFRYVQAFELICDLRPDINRNLAFKIAQTVVIVCDSYGMDHFLVLAVMKTESNFKPNAKSHACVYTEGANHCGARGLMQVMPFWANDYGIRVKDLWDIETNIDVGVGILDYELDNCSRDVKCALSRYYGDRKTGKGSYAWKVNRDYEKFLNKYNSGKSYFDPTPFEELEIVDGDSFGE